jgi:hypothetical protein
MKVKQEIRNERGLKDSEVTGAIKAAKELVPGKSGFRLGNEVRRGLYLHIVVGHNIYTTTIVLSDKDGLAPAYFCNGKFWMTRNGCGVELI